MNEEDMDPADWFKVGWDAATSAALEALADPDVFQDWWFQSGRLLIPRNYPLFLLGVVEYLEEAITNAETPEQERRDTQGGTDVP